MGGRNEQTNIRQKNNDSGGINMSNVKTKIREVLSSISYGENEPATNKYEHNEADTNANTCWSGNLFIPLH